MALERFQDSDGYTPLFFASASGRFEYVKLLLEHGACVNRTSRVREPMCFACYEQAVGVEEVIVAIGPFKLHLSSTKILCPILCCRIVELRHCSWLAKAVMGTS